VIFQQMFTAVIPSAPKKMTVRGEMMKKIATPLLTGQAGTSPERIFSFLRENIRPPGTSGTVCRSVSMLRNGA
jgi:hypothetical protein